jgi:hypothetical protein
MRLCTLAVLVAVFGLPTTVAAKRGIPPIVTPVDHLLVADVVILGKVTDVKHYSDSADPDDTIAVIKVETILLGASNLTEVKVRFLKTVKPAKQIRTTYDEPSDVVLHAGDEGVFFLSKHYRGKYFLINPTCKPILTTESDYKHQVALMTTGVLALSDSMKALRAEKAADRVFAAHVLLARYRRHPPGEFETTKLSATESRAILKALSEADWLRDHTPTAPNGYDSFKLLSLSEEDGWENPAVLDEDDGDARINKVKAAFAKWVDGAGKDYLITKVVPKKGPQMVPPTPPQP